MFTGLIREFGEVISFDGTLLEIGANYSPSIGDSIAINGACLSVVRVGNGSFFVEISSESSKNLALENYKNRVHIEPAMRLSDRVEGHLIQGHIDSIGTITRIEKLEVGVDFFIEIQRGVREFMIPKGSVAIDGVSLTLNSIEDCTIRVTIIPLTLKKTLFGSYKEGRRVNIESDMIVRSLFHINRGLKEKKPSWSEIERVQALY